MSDPAEALRDALEALVGVTQPVEVEVPVDELDLAEILDRPGMTAAMAEAAGYGSAESVRGSALARRERRSFMRRLQRYRGHGAERRTPDAETARAIRELGLNVIRRRRELGGIREIVEAIIARGVTVLPGAEITVLVTSPKRKGRRGGNDERERHNLPAVFIPPGELAEQGFGPAARRAVSTGEWGSAAARLFAAWINSYGIGAAAYVTEVDELELRVGRFGRPKYEGAA